MPNDIERFAACACGQLKVTANGDPDVVTACSCLECQRRTGSPFGVGAYFRRAQVSSIEGAHRSYQRGTDSGRTLTTKFCPECGTPLFWELDMRPDHIGIAVGCFADPHFPGPTRVVWTESRHHWVAFPDNLPTFEQAAT